VLDENKKEIQEHNDLLMRKNPVILRITGKKPRMVKTITTDFNK